MGKGTALATSLGVAVLLLLLATQPLSDWSVGGPGPQMKIRKLALSMNVHCLDQGSLPPAVVYAPDGSPLLSWRVLVLPYQEEEDLYNRFDLKEAWNGPNNFPLLKEMSQTFAPPKGTTTPKPFTTYWQVVVGKGAAFEGTKRLHIPLDFPDGTSKTILIAEARDPQPWTAPVDISYDPDKPLPAFGDPAKDHFLVAMADASVRTVSRSVSEKTLRAAITRNGGDNIGPDW